MKWFVWIILNIFLSGFCLTIFIYKDAVFLKDQFVFYKLIGSGDHFPAGPLLDGSVLSHIFLLPEKILISKEKKQKVCFNLLMANYSGTKYGSDLVFSLEVSDNKFERTYPVDTVKDNAFNQVCFDLQNKLSSLNERMRFSVRSVGALPGQAVTFWLSPDLRQGETLRNGKPSGGSLVTSIALEQEKSIFFLWVIAGIIFCYCSMVTLVLKEWVEWFFCQKLGRK